jgi:hypothetical protein
LRRVLLVRKGNAVNPDQKASADLAKAAIWSEDSLGYTRELGQRKLVWLLEAVKADVEFEESVRATLSRGHLRFARTGYRGAATHDNDRKTEDADDARRRKREVEKYRAGFASWKKFMDSKRRGLELRKGGELGKLLGELSPEDMPARAAANRLRTTWLKERRHVWLPSISGRHG